MKYAMICQNEVIDVIYSNIVPNYPNTNDGYTITAIEISEEQQVSRGMIYENGEFSGEYTPEPTPEPEPTQLDRIEANTQSLMSSNSALDVLLGVSE